MSALTVRIDMRGLARVAGETQGLSHAIEDRAQLHAEVATNVLEFTRAYLRGLNRHATAESLGAQPTGHHESSAASLQAAWDEKQATLRIPRKTGLGRAFSFAIIRPIRAAFLTIPAHADTYGSQAGEPKWADKLRFAVIRTHRGPMPVMIFKEAGGTHEKGHVAFWLRREVYQEQDPTLLPPDEEYRGLMRDTVAAYLGRARVAEGGAA